MSATSAPFGLRPSFHPSGLDRAVALAGGIASGYNTGILKGQPVALDTSGNIIAATAGSAYQGAFAGHCSFMKFINMYFYSITKKV